MNELYVEELTVHAEAMQDSLRSILKRLKVAHGAVRRAVLIAKARELQSALDRLQDELEGYQDVDGLMASDFNADYFSIKL